MKEFFEKNKVFLGIVIGALIIGGAIEIYNQNKNFNNEEEVELGECSSIPELPDGVLKLILLSKKITSNPYFLNNTCLFFVSNVVSGSRNAKGFPNL